MKRIVFGALGLGVLAALAVSGAAVAHLTTASYHRSTLHTTARSNSGGQRSGGMSPSSPAERPTQAQDVDIRSANHVRVYFHDMAGAAFGQVDIAPLATGKGNVVTISAWDLTPGRHAIELHESGRCDGVGAHPFNNAGGLFNPSKTAMGGEVGIFPDLMAGSNGQATERFVDTKFTFKQLAGLTGASVLLHSDTVAGDPMTRTPALRIACGIVFPNRMHPAPSPTASGMPMPMGSPTGQMPNQQPPAMNPPATNAPQPNQSTIVGHHW